MDISRRSFLATTGTGLLAAAAPRALTAQTPQPGGAVTAQQIVDRIKANVGIPWMTTTVDNIVGGSPDVAVKGIATTMMATLDVVKRAAAAGKNMVITHESTFFSHQDKIDDFREDATYRFKNDFIQKNQMAVFHFHDHWHRRSPDGIATGMAREMGWEQYLIPTSPREFVFPEQSLEQLAQNLQTRLKIRTMRVVGDPKLRVKRVLASWGNCSLMPGVPYLARPDIDVLIVGETREWELVEYAQDQIASGLKKALIVLGHVVSEQAGMKYCAEWLKTFITDVPIEFIAADEPFWQPMPSHPK
jgi:putative NIF3 family GTP cyclohydrolase 1 type 2